MASMTLRNQNLFFDRKRSLHSPSVRTPLPSFLKKGLSRYMHFTFNTDRSFLTIQHFSQLQSTKECLSPGQLKWNLNPPVCLPMAQQSAATLSSVVNFLPTSPYVETNMETTNLFRTFVMDDPTTPLHSKFSCSNIESFINSNDLVFLRSPCL